MSIKAIKIEPMLAASVRFWSSLHYVVVTGLSSYANCGHTGQRRQLRMLDSIAVQGPISRLWPVAVANLSVNGSAAFKWKLCSYSETEMSPVRRNIRHRGHRKLPFDNFLRRQWCTVSSIWRYFRFSVLRERLAQASHRGSNAGPKVNERTAF